MGYGPGKLDLVLSYLPANGALLDLGYQKFHGTQQYRGDVGAHMKAGGYWYACLDTQQHAHGEPFDLNDDIWEYELVDVVTNFGTTEHVMNQVNAFGCVHYACKVGGTMIHELPHCRPSHGMFSYNRSFFTGLAKANDYETETLEITSNDTGQQHILAVLHKTHDGSFMPALDYSTR